MILEKLRNQIFGLEKGGGTCLREVNEEVDTREEREIVMEQGVQYNLGGYKKTANHNLEELRRQFTMIWRG